MTAAEKIKEHEKYAEPGRCITCDKPIKKGYLQCPFCEKNYPIKDDKKK